jgi:hypothetical protein
VIISISFGLSFLSFCVFEEKYTNEEINQEETSNQNEDDIEVGISSRVLNFRTFVLDSGVYRDKHNIRPSFESRYNEQT